MRTLLAASLWTLASCASPFPSGQLELFLDSNQPAPDRLVALLALRALEPSDRHRAYSQVHAMLFTEVGHLDGLSVSDIEEHSAVAALEWLAEEKDDTARHRMELYLDRDTVRLKRLPNRVLAAVALGLGKYPDRESARETLWARLRDPDEAPVIRSACMKALQSHHPRDLEERILGLPAPAADAWLRDLQGRLK